MADVHNPAQLLPQPDAPYTQSDGDSNTDDVSANLNALVITLAQAVIAAPIPPAPVSWTRPLTQTDVPSACTALNALDFTSRPRVFAVIVDIAAPVPCHNALTGAQNRMIQLTLIDPTRSTIQINCFEGPPVLDLAPARVGDVILFHRLKLNAAHMNATSYGNDTQWALFRDDELLCMNSNLLPHKQVCLVNLTQAEVQYARYLLRWHRGEM